MPHPCPTPADKRVAATTAQQRPLTLSQQAAQLPRSAAASCTSSSMYPSIDRAHDQGRLTGAPHFFSGCRQARCSLGAAARAPAPPITELAFMPDELGRRRLPPGAGRCRRSAGMRCRAVRCCTALRDAGVMSEESTLEAARGPPRWRSTPLRGFRERLRPCPRNARAVSRSSTCAVIHWGCFAAPRAPRSSCLKSSMSGRGLGVQGHEARTAAAVGALITRT